MNIECIWSGQAVLGEGPVWHPSLQALFWLDIERQCLYRYDPAPQRVQEIKLEQMVTSLVVTSAGDFAISWAKGFARMSVDGQIREAQVTIKNNDSIFNDGKCDRQGRFWAGSKSLPEVKPDGGFYCVQKLDQPILMDTGYIVCNGPCFSPDGRIMYVTNSPQREIYAFDLDPVTGAISNKRVFVKVMADAGYPDGMTIDAQGYLWAGHWDGWRITRYTSEGRIDRVIEMPVPNVTSVCFGGADLNILYVTSAVRDVDAATLKRAPLAGGTFAIEVGVKGILETACCC